MRVADSSRGMKRWYSSMRGLAGDSPARTCDILGPSSVHRPKLRYIRNIVPEIGCKIRKRQRGFCPHLHALPLFNRASPTTSLLTGGGGTVVGAEFHVTVQPRNSRRLRPFYPSNTGESRRGSSLLESEGSVVVNVDGRLSHQHY